MSDYNPTYPLLDEVTLETPFELLFETMFEHMLRQGSAAGNDNYGCMYRDDKGRACAVGCLMNDERAREGGARAFRNTEESNQWAGDDAVRMRFYEEMQNMHDSYLRDETESISIDHPLVDAGRRFVHAWGLDIDFDVMEERISKGEFDL